MKTFVREPDVCAHCRMDFPLGSYPDAKAFEKYGVKLHPKPFMCIEAWSFFAKQEEQSPPAA